MMPYLTSPQAGVLHTLGVFAAYFLGKEARIRKGLGVACSAPLLHFISGLAALLVLLGQMPSALGRNPPTFTAIGCGLIVLAGLVMLVQSVQPEGAAHGGVVAQAKPSAWSGLNVGQRHFCKDEFLATEFDFDQQAADREELLELARGKVEGIGDRQCARSLGYSRRPPP